MAYIGMLTTVSLGILMPPMVTSCDATRSTLKRTIVIESYKFVIKSHRD